ncbi:LOW QUALITY PROTEIN: neuronal acetylcholine receptor subunit beta-3-like [Pomacea canaliculata]|uniref:LOW QUALITY PROTEIN: neuronal acetylcholine receptor subunit beta-3-like n=1 Tax=Pomacea canaliculata TaxID=400727 RepID=UPI000D72EBE1|nr:LOW QUALITY PROTEIN: neuronal acetylcholine receptor subunit beta-3-like [Pomacea canaliculata]
MAQLTCVSLTMAQLTCVSLNMTQLTCVSLTMAQLTCVSLTMAQLTCVSLNMTADMCEPHYGTADMCEPHYGTADMCEPHYDTADMCEHHYDTADMCEPHYDTADMCEHHYDTVDMYCESKKDPASDVMRVLIFTAALLAQLHVTSCQSAVNVTRVHEHVYNVITPYTRPVKNFSTTTNVQVLFYLMAINDFDTASQKLTSTGWMLVQWQNEYLTWDPAAFGGVQTIFPDPTQVWRPRLAIQNTMKDLKAIGEDYVVIMAVYNGIMQWFPAEQFETFCYVDVTCSSGQKTLVKSTSAMASEIDLSFYSGNGAWKMLSTRAFRTNLILNGANFPILVYEVTLKRRPSLLVLTVLMPVLLLAFINVFVFSIPSESGERLSYAITTLLSVGVFMSFILSSMPSSTETVSIMVIDMSVLLILSAFYVLLCIFTLRLFHRDDDKHPVPKAVQTFIVSLEVLLCLEPPSTKVDPVIQVMPVSDQDHQQPRIFDTIKKKQLSRKLAITNPNEMTWRRVSRTLDKFFFRLSLLIVLGSTFVVFALISRS